jgi:hypothetical protein
LLLFLKELGEKSNFFVLKYNLANFVILLEKPQKFEYQPKKITT